MRLFLSDTFYEAVLSLPKKIQSKVIAFQKKFRENNAANGIHLEPIAQFKDNALHRQIVCEVWAVRRLEGAARICQDGSAGLGMLDIGKMHIQRAVSEKGLS